MQIHNDTFLRTDCSFEYKNEEKKLQLPDVHSRSRPIPVPARENCYLNKEVLFFFGWTDEV